MVRHDDPVLDELFRVANVRYGDAAHLIQECAEQIHAEQETDKRLLKWRLTDEVLGMTHPHPRSKNQETTK